jgi:subtilisin family serine protease
MLMRRLVTIALSVLAIALFSAHRAVADEPSSATGRTLVVKLNEQASAKSFAETAKRCGVIAQRHVAPRKPGRAATRLARWRRVTVPEKVDPSVALACLEGDSGIAKASDVPPPQKFAVPDDPDFRRQWHLRSIGQWSGYQDADVDGPEAWNVETGTGSVIVAVMDGGIDYTHEDLAANMWVNTGETPGNSLDDDSNGYVDDVHGYDFFDPDGDPEPEGDPHGTECAGVIAAVGDNATGITGVSWNSKIMAIRGLALVEEVQYAVDNGARVISTSIGWEPYQVGPELLEMLTDAADYALENEVLIFAAAGNCNSLGCSREDIAYPAAVEHDGIVAVAATGEHDELADLSRYDEELVDLAAPGHAIWTTLPGDAYGADSGTSFATPIVAGAAALLLESEPTLTAAQVRARILDNVDELPSLAGKTVTGGRLNVARTLGASPATIDPALAPYDGNHASVEFDGSDDRIDLATLTTIFGGSSPTELTMSVWVKMLEAPPSYGGVVAATSNALATDGLGFSWVPGPRMAFYVDGILNRVETPANFVKPDVWNHLVATYDGGLGSDHLKLFVNGELVDEEDEAGPLSLPSVALEIGRLKAYTGSGNQLNVNARVDDVAIWSVPLSAAEVKALYNRGGVTDLVRLGGAYASAESLLGYWRLGDETDSGTTRDVTERGAATAVNMVADPSSADVPVRFASNRSVTFDGADAHATGPDADALLGSSTGEFTASFWMKASSAPASWDTLIQGMGISDGFGVFFHSATSIRAWVGGLAGNHATATLNPLVWNHVALTFDSALGSGNVRLFVNGTLAATANRSSAMALAATPIDVAPATDVTIDEIAIWTTALTDAEVAELAAEGTPRDVERAREDYVSHRTLAAAWRMGENAAGVTIPDLVGANDLTLVDAGANPIGGDVAQLHDTSFRVIAEGDHVALAPLESILGPNVGAFSLSYWVKLGVCDPLVEVNVGAATDFPYMGTGFSVSWEGPNVFFVIGTDDETLNVAFKANPANRMHWKHIAAVYDSAGGSNNLKLYVDGTAATSDTATGDVLLPLRMLEVGRLSSSAYSSNAWLDELAIFDRALGATEVASIAAGNGASNLLAPFGNYTPTGLKGYWKLGERVDGLVVPDELGVFDGTIVGDLTAPFDGDVPSDPGSPVSCGS